MTRPTSSLATGGRLFASAVLLLLPLAFTGCVDESWKEAATLDVSAADWFTAEEIERGRSFGRERLSFGIASLVLKSAYLVALLASGIGARLATWAMARCGGRIFLAALLWFACVLSAYELLSYPLAVWRGYLHLKHPEYDLLRSTFLEWSLDKLRSTALWLGFAVPLFSVGYWLINRRPRSWWLIAAGGLALVSVVAAYLLPLLIAPLFNEFRPLDEGELRTRLVVLAERAGIDSADIFVVDGSRRSRHANAYFSGIGSSQRIVLYDTLIETQNVEEVESVLAHEIGHWRAGHIHRGLAVGVLGGLVLLFVLDRVLFWAAGRGLWRDRVQGSLAGAPLFLLVVLQANWWTLPVQNAISRSMEREADDAELELADNPRGMISSLVKLARQNISDVDPAPWKHWFFHSHPSTLWRIRRAELELRRRSAPVGGVPDTGSGTGVGQ